MKIGAKAGRGSGCCTLIIRAAGVPVNAQSVTPFVTCVSNRDVLRQNLLRSPDVAALGVRTYERQQSAAAAYNDALANAGREGEFTIFLHQDMYLPAGWLDRLNAIVARLAIDDPSWGVLGCYGITESWGRIGHVYSNGYGVLGRSYETPAKVRTLDEIVLVVRHVSGLRFTDGHPGFHLYGTDICLRAEQLGLNCYAIDNYCVHNTRQQSYFPLQFYSGYCAVRRNYPAALPVKTACTNVMSSLWPIRRTFIRQRIAKLRGMAPVTERLPDPTVVL